MNLDLNWELSHWLDRIHTFDIEGYESDRAQELRLFFGHLKQHHDKYELDEILVALAETGAAPSVLYDDNGHWSISCDGSHTMLDERDYETKTTILQSKWYVPAKHWQKSPREALAVYLENWGK